MEEQKNAIAAIIKDNWADNDFIQAWNQRCDSCNYPDDMIFENNEDFINENYTGTPFELARLTVNGDYDPNDYFVRLDMDGDPISFGDLFDDPSSPFELYELADYLMDYGDVHTKGVDSDSLKEYFVDMIVENHNLDEATVELRVEKYLEDEDFDFLTEDWEILETEICDE